MRLVVAIDPTDFGANLHSQRGGFKRKILDDDLICGLFSRALAVHRQNHAGQNQCECEKKIPFIKHCENLPYSFDNEDPAGENFIPVNGLLE
jgi:hypothetical protein